MLTARIHNRTLTVDLLLDVSIFNWTRLEATTNLSHTSKLWCMIFIEMASVSIIKMQFLFILNILIVYIKKIYWLVGFAYGLVLFHTH